MTELTCVAPEFDDNETDTATMRLPNICDSEKESESLATKKTLGDSPMQSTNTSETSLVKGRVHETHMSESGKSVESELHEEGGVVDSVVDSQSDADSESEDTMSTHSTDTQIETPIHKRKTLANSCQTPPNVATNPEDSTAEITSVVQAKATGAKKNDCETKPEKVNLEKFKRFSEHDLDGVTTSLECHSENITKASGDDLEVAVESFHCDVERPSKHSEYNLIKSEENLVMFLHNNPQKAAPLTEHSALESGMKVSDTDIESVPRSVKENLETVPMDTNIASFPKSAKDDLENVAVDTDNESVPTSIKDDIGTAAMDKGNLTKTSVTETQLMRQDIDNTDTRETLDGYIHPKWKSHDPDLENCNTSDTAAPDSSKTDLPTIKPIHVKVSDSQANERQQFAKIQNAEAKHALASAGQSMSTPDIAPDISIQTEGQKLQTVEAMGQNTRPDRFTAAVDLMIKPAATLLLCEAGSNKMGTLCNVDRDPAERDFPISSPPNLRGTSAQPTQFEARIIKQIEVS